MFMSIEEIERLTGKKRPSAQIRWLTGKGYKFDVNGLNQPIVAVAELNRKLVGGTAVRQPHEPNWEAMPGRTNFAVTSRKKRAAWRSR